MDVNTVKNEIASNKANIIKWRRELHKIPEVGLYLPNTSNYIQEKLKEMNIDFRIYENHSGISAVIGKGKGRVIAIRSDMDALPIKEDGNLEFKSINDNMHACGHDGHMAILLGVCKFLKEHEEEIKGCIKIIFQPCEECAPGGALEMIKDKVLENPKVDAILALHIDNKKRKAKNGDVLVRYNSMFAHEDPINIKIIGRGGHASEPHNCIDSISIATLVINNLQYIINREINAAIPTVLSIGSINSNTISNNIIPDIVEIKGTIRNTDTNTRKYMLKRIEEIVNGLTKIMNADYEFTYDGGCRAVINDKNMVERFLKSSEKILNKYSIHVLNDYNMEAEDAGFFFERIPGCYFLLHNPKQYEDGEIYPLHNSKYVMDDSVLYIGAQVLVQTALDYLEEPSTHIHS